MHFLTKRLEDAVVVGIRQGQRGDKVFFGATVEIEDEERARHVPDRRRGRDRQRLRAHQLAARRSVATLIGKRAGDVITVRRPAGEAEMELISVRYG